MHVVGHKAVRVQEEWKFALLHGQQRQELLVVCRRIEYLPAIIAARDHVIETTGNFGASFSGHERRMLGRVDPAVKTS
jgi:hypothetical protein